MGFAWSSASSRPGSGFPSGQLFIGPPAHSNVTAYRSASFKNYAERHELRTLDRAAGRRGQWSGPALIRDFVLDPIDSRPFRTL